MGGGLGGLRKHGEAQWNEQGGNEVGDEGIGGHLFQTASKLGRYYGGRGGTWRDDYNEDGFEHHQGGAANVEAEDYAQKRGHEHYLLETDPQMPSYRAELLEIHFAKCDVEDEEHEVGQNVAVEWGVSAADGFQKGNKVEQQIDTCARDHGHGKRPVPDKSNHFAHHN